MTPTNIKLTHGHEGSDNLWIGQSHETNPIARVEWDTSTAHHNARENAARICLAWNMHDELIATLKDAEAHCGVLELETIRTLLKKAGATS
jgi:hypothetical protein